MEYIARLMSCICDNRLTLYLGKSSKFGKVSEIMCSGVVKFGKGVGRAKNALKVDRRARKHEAIRFSFIRKCHQIDRKMRCV